MENSTLPMRKWAIVIYLVTTNLKGVSSMTLHRDLGIAQKNAWHMLHRIRKAMQGGDPLFRGPVEADETYIGGREANKHDSKKLHLRGTVGKAAVAGMKDRETDQITADNIFQGLIIFNECLEHPALAFLMAITPVRIKTLPLPVNAELADHGAPLQVGFGYLLQPPGPCQPRKGAQGQTLTKADGK